MPAHQLSAQASAVLAAQLTLAALETLLVAYKKKMGWFDNSPIAKITAFITPLETNAAPVVLDAQQLFEVAKILYDLDLYNLIYGNKRNQALLSNFLDQTFGAKHTALRT